MAPPLFWVRSLYAAAKNFVLNVNGGEYIMLDLKIRRKI